MLVRIAGIEPASSPWQREILPFNHIRKFDFVKLVIVEAFQLNPPGPFLAFYSFDKPFWELERGGDVLN